MAVDGITLSLALLPINLLPTLVVLAGITGVGLVRGRWLWRDPLNGLIGAVGIWMLGITFWAYDWRQSLLGAANHLPFLLFFLVASYKLRTAGLRDQIATVIVLGSLWVSVLGLGQALWGWQGRLHLGAWTILTLIDWPRPTSIFPSHNILAIYLVLCLAVGAGLYLRGKAQWLVIGAYLLGAPLLFLSASRNGWGIACMAMLLGLILYRRWLGLGILAGVCGLCLGAAVGIPGLRWIVPGLIWQRLAATFDPNSAFFSSTLNRLDAWRFALEMIRDRPWQGWGWQSFPTLYNSQLPAPAELLNHCHNLYLSLGSEGGVPVLIGLIGIWIWICGRGWRTWITLPQDLSCGDLESPPALSDGSLQGRSAQAPLLCGFLVALSCYFLSGLLDVVYFDGRINVLVWVMLAAVNGHWWQQRGSQGESSRP